MEMEFRRDIFISYAHIDNVALKEGEIGWVTDFHRALEIRLAQLLGARPRIWRDQKLKGNDSFSDEILQQFPNTAAMVSIFSPVYIKSVWCTKEVRGFYETAVKGIGIKIDNKSRLFKVVKTAVPYGEYPPEAADTLGYEFFVSDPYIHRVKELNQGCGGELEQLYWAKLDDVAHDIRDLLVELEHTDETIAGRPRDREPRQPPEPHEQLTVYLAETGSDLKTQRDTIKRELLEFGYGVLPDSRLPVVEPEFSRSVNGFLDRCELSIHLVGGSYGPVPEGSRQSIVPLQNELAAQKSSNGKLQRLVWIMPGKYPGIDDERQDFFLHRLRTDARAQYGADVVENSIETFKHTIHDKLKRMKSTAAISVPGKKRLPAPATVYLAETNYHLKDQRETVKRQLIRQGFHVVPTHPLPLVYPELVQVLDDLLDQCDISIHLLGADYGVVPDKTDKSIIYIQQEHAAEKSRQGKLQRLVWVSPRIDREDQRQQSFIRDIKASAHMYPGDDIFETPIEEMAGTVLNKFDTLVQKKRKKRDEEKSAAVAEPLQIYLICDRGDLDNITELEDCLYRSEFDVILPAFQGEEAELIRDHRESLKSCDAVLIYYGSGSDLWMRAITRGLTGIAAYGRACPLLLNAAFLAPPVTAPKKHFRSHGILVIDGMKGFSPQLLEPFVNMLRSVKRG
jgi:hypothetical protein